MTDSIKVPAILTPDDLAEYLGITVETLYQWKYRGYGPRALKIGNRLRYRAKDVQRWIAAQGGGDGAEEAAGDSVGGEGE